MATAETWNLKGHMQKVKDHVTRITFKDLAWYCPVNTFKKRW
jgi:hypothetical protein